LPIGNRRRAVSDPSDEFRKSLTRPPAPSRRQAGWGFLSPCLGTINFAQFAARAFTSVFGFDVATKESPRDWQENQIRNTNRREDGPQTVLIARQSSTFTNNCIDL